MQTPQGFSIGADERLYPTNWLQVIFNPSFPYRLIHMVIAAYLTTAFMVGGVGSLYLLKKRYIEHAKIMLGMATIMAIFVAPMQLLVGDAHGLNTLRHQPAKIAAMEGLWQSSSSVPLLLFALPDQAKKKNTAEVGIPNLASLILTHNFNGEIKGLNAFGHDIPPVLPVFFAFRIMVGIGILMIFIGIASATQFLRHKLFDTRWLHIWWILMMPSGFIAIIAGWFVNEIGRQPYVVYHTIKTASGVSPAILGPQVAWSLLAFVIMYAFIFGAGSFYIAKLISKGIIPPKTRDQYYKHSKAASVIETVATKGDHHV
jgi:cytochrome d ubiquinol oxidase subunit I